MLTLLVQNKIKFKTKRATEQVNEKLARSKNICGKQKGHTCEVPLPRASPPSFLPAKYTSTASLD